MVVIGRGVAGETPHNIRAVPADTQRAGDILRHGHDRHCAAQRFFATRYGIEPELDETADPLADLHRRQCRGRQRIGHRRVDRLDPGGDHVHRNALVGEARDIGIHARLLRRHRERGVVPAVEHRRIGEQRCEMQPQFVERHLVGICRNFGCAAGHDQKLGP